MPRALSDAAAEYLDEAAHVRLSRQIPQPRALPRPASSASIAGGGVAFGRSASAPRERPPSARGELVASTMSVGSTAQARPHDYHPIAT